ncbi:GlcG/HbpS family heme-binding protein [Natranaerofaba carboxydovora]|uniref:GlcG/HbpS family heme-binding protein n=1 Tax=Natranaerofaba carboxydovora TaxID=2742683 RepID=UPI003B84813E
MYLKLRDALKVIENSEKKAEEIGVPMVTTVVDAGGNMVAQHRMDDALLASIDISLNKAFTAAAVKLPTHELADAAKPGAPLFGIQNTNQGRIVIFGGGFPIFDGDQIIGAVGVSGGSVEQDMECAKAGLEALK